MSFSERVDRLHAAGERTRRHVGAPSRCPSHSTRAAACARPASVNGRRSSVPPNENVAPPSRTEPDTAPCPSQAAMPTSTSACQMPVVVDSATDRWRRARGLTVGMQTIILPLRFVALYLIRHMLLRGTSQQLARIPMIFARSTLSAGHKQRESLLGSARYQWLRSSPVPWSDAWRRCSPSPPTAGSRSRSRPSCRPQERWNQRWSSACPALRQRGSANERSPCRLPAVAHDAGRFSPVARGRAGPSRPGRPRPRRWPGGTTAARSSGSRAVRTASYGRTNSPSPSS